MEFLLKFLGSLDNNWKYFNNPILKNNLNYDFFFYDYWNIFYFSISKDIWYYEK